MSCHKCGGLMVPDHDRDSETGERCINCGSPGGGRLAMPVQENCKKAKCTDPKAEDSVYCARHRDMKRAANKKAAARRKGASVAPVKKKPRDRKPPPPRLKDAPPPPPATQGNGHPGKHVQIVAAYIQERIAFLQDEIQQLEKAAAVLAVLALPPE